MLESKPPLTNIFSLYVYIVIGCFFISKKTKQKILPDSTYYGQVPHTAKNNDWFNYLMTRHH